MNTASPFTLSTSSSNFIICLILDSGSCKNKIINILFLRDNSILGNYPDKLVGLRFWGIGGPRPISISGLHSLLASLSL